LFSGSLFSGNGNKNSLFPSSGSLFSSGGSSLPSLFSNINGGNQEGGSLFSSLTQNTGGFFLNSQKIGGDDDDEEGSGEEDEKEDKRSDSPEVYRPTTEKTTGPYSKKYIKLVDNFSIYDKKEKKYHSKGDGYLSIEYVEEPKKVH